MSLQHGLSSVVAAAATVFLLPASATVAGASQNGSNIGAYFVRKSRRPALQGEEPATADAGIAMGAHPCCPMEPLRRSYRGRRQNHPS